MIAIYIVFSFAVGVYLGVKIYKLMVENEINKENEKLITNINNQFNQVLKNISSGTSRFKSRINTTVHIESSLIDHGNIDIIYLLDKNDIAIFQGTRCLYTSDKVDKSVVESITETINVLYKKEISEVVDFFGLVLSKKEFERQFKLDVDDIQNLVKNVTNNNQISEIEKINLDNQNRYDIDEILDKISAFGMKVLTPEELVFLDKYSNEKGNKC